MMKSDDWIDKMLMESLHSINLMKISTLSEQTVIYMFQVFSSNLV